MRTKSKGMWIIMYLVVLVWASLQSVVMALSSDEWQKAWFEARMECDFRKMTTPLPPEGTYCNMTFDDLACWGYTPANTTASMLCPEYIMLQDAEITEYAYKKCEANGEWYQALNFAGELDQWTNYTACQKPGNDETEPEIFFDLQIIYTIGYSLSLVALLVAMVIFLYFRKLRCPRNTIHMHLFMSFILRAIFVFIRDKVQDDIESQKLAKIAEGFDIHNMDPLGTPGCKAAFSLIQYFLVANFYWLLVEGVYLHSLITLSVFSESSNLIGYILLGWGCPVLVVLPWTIVQTQLHKEGCWWEQVTTDSFYWIIKGPVMFAIVINFFLFLNILRVIFTKLRATNSTEVQHQYSKMAKSTLVLIPLFGVYYIISVGMYASKDPLVTKIRMYFELTLSPIQGFLVALLYCFMNAEVRCEIKRKWRVRQLNRNLSTHRSYRNGNSSTFNDIREPLRPASRASTSNSHPQRTQSNVKDRFLALKKNAFGSSNNNGHVQLGNGRLPKLSRTDTSDAESSPQNSCKVSPIKAAESDHLYPKIESNEVVHSDSETAKTLVKQSNNAPLVRTMSEFNRIHDSHAELNKDESACALLSKEHVSDKEETLTPSAPLSGKYDSDEGAACITGNQSDNIEINNGGESPPAYNELFPDTTKSSMTNIETQV